jgi:hypothetical protein
MSVGCGPNYKARAIVKGKVSINGKALTVGNVMFYGANNMVGQAPISKEGTYVMNDAPLGAVNITVTVPKGPPGGIARMKGFGKDTKSVDPEGSGKSISIMGDMPSIIVPIPDRFSNVDTSGLTFTVVRGEQTVDIDLKP